ncbi:hypothetical protein VNI00_008208 [Paramarasmius palmivorus]|uniref:Non-structural maintenance of chromosomes element 1 homolog n=1 Tax=Paramarasmius palmivorus TaxID=297713 RepID=A0AAW0CZG0_9AGAR
MPVSSGDVQRLFLQAILSRGILSEDLARIIWQQCIKGVKAVDDTVSIAYNNTDASWESFIANVNTSLNDLELEFKDIMDELSGKKLYALVNRKDDDLAQMATDFTPNEIVFFKAIVEQIMLARKESYSLSSLAALQEVTALKDKVKMTKAQAECVLASFVTKGWLLKSKRGRYSLSPRTILELAPYLKATYPDEILECQLCLQMLTKGVACPRTNCKTRMHFSCFRTYRNQDRQRGKQCSTCKIDWPQEAEDMTPVGEAAVRDGEDGRRRVRARTASDGEDTDRDMEGLSQNGTQPSQPSRTQKSRKGKGKGKKMVVDEAEDEDEDEDDAEADFDEMDEEEDTKPRTQRRRSTRH